MNGGGWTGLVVGGLTGLGTGSFGVSWLWLL